MPMSIEVVGMAEAAQIVGVTKSNFSAHRAKHTGENECPEPTATLTCGPVWVGTDVKLLRKWAERFSKVRVTRAPAKTKEEVTAKPAAKASKVAKKATKPAAKASKSVAKAPVAKAASSASTPKKAANAKKEAAPAAASTPKKGLFGS